MKLNGMIRGVGRQSSGMKSFDCLIPFCLLNIDHTVMLNSKVRR